MGFVKWLNSKLNPNHNWFNYGWFGRFKDSLKQGIQNVGDFVSNSVGDLPNQLGSFVNSITGAHLTGSQVEANEMQMQNQEDIYQRQVTGMQKAGINPALMYQSGASSAPGVQGSQGTGSMSEIMQALLLERQAKLLDSQSRNIDADTDKKVSETAYQSLINKYYPDVTDSQIKKVLSEVGLNEKTIEEIGSRIELQDLDKELKRVDKVIKQAEADESSAYFKALREFEQAQGEKAKAEKGEIAVRAAIEQIEKEFMQHTNTKMGSATVIAVASAIGTLLSKFQFPPFSGEDGGTGLPFDNEDFRSSLKRDLMKLFNWIDSHMTAYD